MFLQEPLPILWQKRAFDIIMSAFLLVLTLPLFAVFLLFIFIEHVLRGHPLDPLFYSEMRISRGEPFRIYKFNIFNQRKIDAMHRSGTFIHTKELEKNGGAILFGKFLKQIYLDELPQLFNVLRGDMSLVGPRPLNLEVFANNAQDRTPAVALLLGGMTGNFQSFKNTRGKSARDLNVEYLEQYKKGNGWKMLLLDIRIILRTIKVLLRAKGV